MATLSNKQDKIRDLFEHLNYRKAENKKLDRIDTFELISVILLSIDGNFESFIKNVIAIFGFDDQQNQKTITKEEFHFYLDCLFRGVMAIVVPPELVRNHVDRHKFQNKQIMPHIGKCVDTQDIEQIVKLIFTNDV